MLESMDSDTNTNITTNSNSNSNTNSDRERNTDPQPDINSDSHPDKNPDTHSDEQTDGPDAPDAAVTNGGEEGKIILIKRNYVVYVYLLGFKNRDPVL